MFSVDKFKYSILDKNNVFGDSHATDLYNDVYRYWKKTWQKILLEAGSPQTWSADDFFRQNYINVITFENEIVAANCSTVFNLKSSCVRDTKYFSIFNQKVYDWLENNHTEKLMTMEFLSVAEKWRESSMGFSFAEVLIGLGSKMLEEQNLCAAVGVSVKAAGITRKSSCHNYSLVTDDVERGRLPCDVICLNSKSIQRHQDEKVATIIDALWQNKNNFRQVQLNEAAA